MWDLDARGFHKSTWRFWIKKNHILAVGCPASEYCKNKTGVRTDLFTKQRNETKGSYLSLPARVLINIARVLINIGY